MRIIWGYLVACLLVSIFVGITSADDKTCAYKFSSNFAPGAPITVNGPTDTSGLGRTYIYAWQVYKLDQTMLVGTAYSKTDTGAAGQSFTFPAPATDGCYYVQLTVKDSQVGTDTVCVDVKCVKFCVALTCPTCTATVCEESTAPGSATHCPYYLCYTNEPAGAPADLEYRWYVARDGGKITFGVTGTNGCVGPINWNAEYLADFYTPATHLPLTPGTYTLSFEIWGDDPSTGATTIVMLEECPSVGTVTVVDDPTAVIAGTGVVAGP